MIDFFGGIFILYIIFRAIFDKDWYLRNFSNRHDNDFDFDDKDNF